MGVSKKKTLVFVSVFAVLVSLFSSLPVAASGTPQAGKPEQPQAGHARPPIYYNQVPAPIRPDKPGKGPPGTTSVVYTPANIGQAYNFGKYANGTGKTIAIVDAYGDPTIVSDVAAFNARYGLADATMNITYPDGTPTATNSNWALETALDVEWVHASAPNAAIVLIVAKDSSFQSLLDCIQYATDNLDVVAISMSFGAPEAYVDATTRANYEAVFARAASKGILLFASSGDSGAYDGTHPKQLTPDYPSSSPNVIGVGGTTLTLNSLGGYGSETAWKGSGGGYSLVFGEPSYQQTAQITDPGGKRGAPDVAFDADPNTGVSVCSNGSWYSVGGTSVGAPNWAAISADIAASSSPPLTLVYLYGTVYGVNGGSLLYANEIHDIKSGNNGYYTAVTGWDAATGIGTPNVSNLILAQ